MKKSSTYNLKTAKLPEAATFAGIDYHKKFFVVSFGDADGNLLAQIKRMSTRESVREVFSRYPRLVCAIENCRGKEWFVEELKNLGCEVKVSNTYLVRLIAESRCKTDKIDSRILMELLAKNFLPTVYQPSPEEIELRERLRFRTGLMRSRTQYKNRAHALLDKENKSASVDSTKRRAKIFDSRPLEPHRQEILNGHLEVIEFFQELVVGQDKLLEAIADSSEDARRLKTIPGFGDLCSLMFLAEVGDVSRFHNARKITGYFGLACKLYSSSDVRRQGSITKQGSGLMRWMLVQAAWHCVRISPYFKQRFNDLRTRKGKGTAIVAIARMLAEVAFRLLKDQAEYDETRLWRASLASS